MTLFFSMLGLMLSAIFAMILLMIGSPVLSTLMIVVTFIFLVVAAYEMTFND